LLGDGFAHAKQVCAKSTYQSEWISTQFSTFLFT